MKTSDVIKLTSGKIVQFVDNTTQQPMWGGIADTAPFWCWSRPFVAVNNGQGSINDPVRIEVVLNSDYRKFLDRLGIQVFESLTQPESAPASVISEPEEYTGINEDEAWLIQFRNSHKDKTCTVAEWREFCETYEKVHNTRPSASGWSVKR